MAVNGKIERENLDFADSLAAATIAALILSLNASDAAELLQNGVILASCTLLALPDFRTPHLSFMFHPIICHLQDLAMQCPSVMLRK
jgi:hypothetical protein